METPIKLFDGGRYFVATIPDGWDKVRNGKVKKGDMLYNCSRFSLAPPCDYNKPVRDYLLIIRKKNDKEKISC